MNEPESKLLLIEQGTSTDDLDFCRTMLEYYGYTVKEFPSGPTEMWTDIYNKEI